nr:hypothetical protein [Tanacetum cinerariifolium]
PYDVPRKNAKYCHICDMLPLKNEEGLVWKALQTYEPHFCRDTSKISGSGLLWLLSTLTECSILMICLRSIDTSDLDYVFEFLWPQSQNYFVMLQTVLLTLKSVSEWQGPKFVKRKLSELSESQTDSGTANNDPYLDDDNDDQVNDNDAEVLIMLDHGSYMLEYEVDDAKWLMLNNDEHFTSCIRNWRATCSKHVQVFYCLTSSALANGKVKIEEEFNMDSWTYRSSKLITDSGRVYMIIVGSSGFAPVFVCYVTYKKVGVQMKHKVEKECP